MFTRGQRYRKLKRGEHMRIRSAFQNLGRRIVEYMLITEQANSLGNA